MFILVYIFILYNNKNKICSKQKLYYEYIKNFYITQVMQSINYHEWILVMDPYYWSTTAYVIFMLIAVDFV